MVRRRLKQRGWGQSCRIAQAPSTATAQFAKYWIVTRSGAISGSWARKWNGRTAKRYIHQRARRARSRAASRIAFGAQKAETGADGNASQAPALAANK